MHSNKRKRLEAKGWKVGSTRDFLGLSEQEEAYVEIKLRLAESLRNQRMKRHMTQADVAKAIKSSQSRVEKMEALRIAGPSCADAARSRHFQL